MLAIQIGRAVWAEVSRLPRLARIGLALMPVAFVADVVVHLSPALHHHSAGFVPQEHLAHLLGILAMVLVLVSVVFDGARRHRPAKEDSHAHR